MDCHAVDQSLSKDCLPYKVLAARYWQVHIASAFPYGNITGRYSVGGIEGA